MTSSSDKKAAEKQAKADKAKKTAAEKAAEKRSEASSTTATAAAQAATSAQAAASAAASRQESVRDAPQLNQPTPDDAPFPAHHTNLYRCPPALLRAVPWMDSTPVPFFRPSANMHIANTTTVAIRCRAAFKVPRAMWKAERGYVRDLLMKAEKIVFYRNPGRFPVLLVSGIQPQPIALEIGECPREAALSRITCIDPYTPPSADSANNANDIIDLAGEAEDPSDRQLIIFSGSQTAVTAVGESCEAAYHANSSPVTARVRSSWISSLVRSMRSDDNATTTTEPPKFDEIRFRTKRSYIKDVELATAFVTPAELKDITSKIDVTAMPATHVEDHDDAREKHQLTIRWKEKTDQAVVLQACVALQRHARLQASTYLITYGNVRVTLACAADREALQLVRSIVNPAKSDKIIVMSDIPLPKTAAVEHAWKPSRTIFRSKTNDPNAPAPAVVQPPPPFRRMLQTTGTLTWKQVFKLTASLRCELVDCNDEYTLAPMSYLVDFEDETALRALSGDPIHLLLPGGQSCDVMISPQQV